MRKIIVALIVSSFVVSGCKVSVGANSNASTGQPNEESDKSKWYKTTLFSENGTIVRQWVTQSRPHGGVSGYSVLNTSENKRIEFNGTWVIEPYLPYRELVSIAPTPMPISQPTPDPYGY